MADDIDSFSQRLKAFSEQAVEIEAIGGLSESICCLKLLSHVFPLFKDILCQSGGAHARMRVTNYAIGTYSAVLDIHMKEGLREG